MCEKISLEEVIRRDTIFLKEMVAERIKAELPDCTLVINESGVMCDEQDRAYVLSVEAKVRELIEETALLGLMLGIGAQPTSDYNPRRHFNGVIRRATPLFAA